MDMTSSPTGKTCFVLAEVYESVAGVTDHYQQAQSWKEFPAFAAWLGQCQVNIVSAAPIAHSLW
jgi:hypothetical protein